MKNDFYQLEAVFDSDLEKILRGLDLFEKIEKEEIKCFFCKRVITLQNLLYIFPQKGVIRISCDSKECLQQFASYGGKL